MNPANVLVTIPFANSPKIDMYGIQTPLARPEVVQGLDKAATFLVEKNPNHRLRLWRVYMSPEEQSAYRDYQMSCIEASDTFPDEKAALREILRTITAGEGYTSGRFVDVGVLKRKNWLLPMGAAYSFTSVEVQARYTKGVSPRHTKNRMRLREAMMAAGFIPTGVWWLFKMPARPRQL